MFRRILSIVMSLFLLLPSGGSVAFATDAMTVPVNVYFTSSKTSANVGDTFPVSIKVSDPGAMRGVDFKFTYDPNMIELVDALGDPATTITAGSKLPRVGSNQVDTNQNGTKTVWFAAAGSADLANGDTLAYTFVKVLSGGSVTFGFDSLLVKDGTLPIPMELTSTSAMISITLVGADTVAPTFTVTANPSTVNATGNVTVTVSSSEALAATPTLSVTAPGATQGTSVNLSSVQGQTNTWSGTFAVTTAMPDGDYSIAVSGQDAASNSGSGTATFTVALDRTAPSLLLSDPTVPRGGIATYLDATHAARGGEQVHFSVNPTEALAGDGVPTVTLTGISGLTASLSSTENGIYYFIVELPGDTNGTVTIEADGADAAGNEATQVSKQFKVDSTPPTVTVENVEEGGAYKEVTVIVSATDNFDSSVTPNITLTRDEVPVTGFTSGTKLTEEGLYALTVDATDGAGNSAALQRFDFVVDHTPPILTVEGVADGAVGNQNVSVTFSATGGTATATLDGNAYTSATEISTEGDHTLVVTASDLAGNSDTATRSFTIDKTAPAISVTGVENGKSYQSANVSISVTDVLDLSPNSTIVLTKDGTEVSDFTSGETLSAEGDYVLTVDASDAAGNKAAQKVISFTIDTTGPTITVTGVENTIYGTDVTVSIGADDSGTALTPTVSLFKDGTAITGFTGGTLSDEGNYLLTVNASDAAGNAATETVVSFKIDKTAPTVTVSGVPASGFAKAAFTPVFTMQDVNADQSTLDFSVTKDGAGFTWTAGTAVTEEGTYRFSVSGEDEAGNLLTGTTQFTYVLDLQAPTVTIVRPANGKTVGNTNLVVEATVDDSLAGIDASTIVLKVGDVVRTHTYNADTKSVAFALTNPADGAYTVTLSVADKAGNSAEAGAWSFTVDSHAPIVTLHTSPVTPDGTNGWYKTQPTAAFTVDAAAATIKYAITAKGAPVDTWTTYESGVEITIPVDEHTLHFYAIRSDNNLESTEATWDYKVDLTDPTITSASHDKEGLRLKFGASVEFTLIGEPGGTAKVSIANFAKVTDAAMTEQSVTPGTYKYTYPVADGDNVEGAIITFTLTDPAGRSVTFTTPDGNGVTFDTTKPTVTAVTATATRDGQPRTGPLKAGDVLTVSAGTEEGATVTFSLGTAAVSIPMVADEAGTTYSGSWTVPAGVNLTGRASVKSVDVAGNESDLVNNDADITIDTTAPALTLKHLAIVPLKGGTTFTLTAYGEAGLTPEYRIGVPAAGDASVYDRIGTTPFADGVGLIAAGQFSTTATAGKYTATLTIPSDVDAVAAVAGRIVDAAGNVTDNVALPIVIDNTPPTITSFTADPADPVNSGKVTFTLVGEAGLKAKLSIGTLRVDVPMAESATTPGTYTYVFDVAPNMNFSAQVSAKLTDRAGNIENASPLTLTVDTIAPATKVAVTKAAGGPAPDGPNKWYLTAPTVALTPEAGSTLSWSVNGVAQPDATEAVTWTPAAGALGVYTIAWHAVDPATNAEVERSLRLKVDLADPAEPTLNPALPATAVKDTKVTFAGTAEPEGTVAIVRTSTVSGTEHTTGLGVIQADVNGAFSTEIPLIEGANTIKARVIRKQYLNGDTAIPGSERASAWLAPVTVVRDTRGPDFKVTETHDANNLYTVTVKSNEEVAAAPAGTLIIGTAAPVNLDLAPAGDKTWTGTFTLQAEDSGKPVTINVTGTDTVGNAGKGFLNFTSVATNTETTVTIDNLDLLKIPAGFLKNVVNAIISANTTDENLDKLGEIGAVAVGSARAFNVNGSGRTFDVPVLVTLPAAGDKASAQKMTIFYFNPDTGKWQPWTDADGTITYNDDGSISFTTGHFSDFVVGQDVTPPTVTITGPANNFLSNSKDVTLAFTTADGTAKYRWSLDGGTTWSAYVNAADGDLTQAVTLVEGTNSITVSVEDAAGNAATASVTVDVDSTPPAITLDTPEMADGGSLTIGTNTLAIAGTSEVGVPLTLKVNGGADIALGDTGNFNGAVDLVAGNNTLAFSATDAAGNTGSASYTVVYDNVAPPLIGVSPADGTVTANNSVTVTGTSEVGATVVVKLDGVEIGSQELGAAAFSQVVPLVTDQQTYTIDVIAHDEFNNTASTSVSIRRNSQVPSIDVTWPANRTKDTSVDVTLTATNSTTVSASVNDGDETVLGESGALTYTVNMTDDGTYTVTITALNNAGPATETYTIILDTTPPVLNVTAPQAKVPNSQDKVTISGTTEAGATVTGTRGADTKVDVADGAGAFTLTDIPLSVGANTIKIKTADDLGNTSPEQTFTVTRASAGGGGGGGGTPAPTISASAATNLTKDATALITGSATVGAQVTISKGGQTLKTLTSTGSFSYTATLAEGDNEFTLTATNAGGTASASVKVTRDTTPPALSVSGPNGTVSDPKATLTITTEKGAKVTVNGQSAGTAPDSGVITREVSLNLGDNLFNVTAADALGNSATASATITRAEPPQVKVSVHAGKQKTVKTSVEIWGNATVGSTVTVSVNGVSVGTVQLDAKGDYTSTVELGVIGQNTITAAAKLGDSVDSDSVTIERLQEPELKDTKGHWAEGHIKRLVAEGVISGFEDGSFKPEATVTRAQFAKMIVLALGLTVEDGAPLNLTDADQVPAWARGYVAAAIKAGLITGFEDGSFQADQEITRIQIAVILSRGLKVKGVNPNGNSHAFNDKIPDWAKDAVNNASGAGLINGFEDNTFRPSEKATRGQAAVMTARLMDAK